MDYIVRPSLTFVKKTKQATKKDKNHKKNPKTSLQISRGLENFQEAKSVQKN
jgi:hypothetical protein